MSKENINPKTQKVQLNIPPTAKVKIADLKPKEKTVVKESNKK